MTSRAFTAYCLQFYGSGGIYDMNATAEEIEEATAARLERFPRLEFCGDTVDREKVRDLMLERRAAFIEQRRKTA